jgi:hypothetical protein
MNLKPASVGLFLGFLSIMSALLVYSLFFNYGLSVKIDKVGNFFLLDLHNFSKHRITGISVVSGDFFESIPELNAGERKTIKVAIKPGKQSIKISADFHQAIENVFETGGIENPEISFELRGDSTLRKNSEAKQILHSCSDSDSPVDILFIFEVRGIENGLKIEPEIFRQNLKKGCADNELIFKAFEEGTYGVIVSAKTENWEQSIMKTFEVV